MSETSAPPGPDPAVCLREAISKLWPEAEVLSCASDGSPFGEIVCRLRTDTALGPEDAIRLERHIERFQAGTWDRACISVLSLDAGIPIEGRVEHRISAVARSTRRELHLELARRDLAGERDPTRLGRELALFTPDPREERSVAWLAAGTIIYEALRACLRQSLETRGFVEMSSPDPGLPSHPRTYVETLAPRGPMPPWAGLLRSTREVRRFSVHIECSPRDVAHAWGEAVDLVRDLFQACEWEKPRFEVRSSIPAEITPGTDSWEGARGLAQGLEEEASACGKVLEIAVPDLLGRMPGERTRIQVERAHAAGSVAPSRTLRVAIAPLASVEDWIATLLEQGGGWLPVRFAPVQVKVLMVSHLSAERARRIEGELQALGVRCRLDASGEKFGFKVQAAIHERIPGLAIVGEEEERTGSIGVRWPRRPGVEERLSVEDLARRILSA